MSLQTQRLAEPINSRAINFFMSAFSGGVYLDYLPTIYGHQERPASLQMSLEAVALAHMANEHHRKDLRQMALRSYGAALSQTSLAVQNIRSTKKLETATSVLLLALFSVISSQSSNETRKTWSGHIRGALAILASCASDMFSSVPAQGILHHVISTIQIDCIHRCVRLPAELEALYTASWLNHGPQAQLWSLIGRLAELNASFGEIPASRSYLAKIRDVDLGFEKLLISMPEAYSDMFEFEECTTDATELPKTENTERIKVHRFKSYRAAQTWNTLRLLRLLSIDLLKSTTSAYLPSVSHGTYLHGVLERFLEGASETSKRITMDICATVPWYLRPDQSIQFKNKGAEESAWARSLWWPLSMAKITGHNSDVLRDYIERQLQVLGSIPSMRSLDLETNSASFSSAVNW